MINLRLLPGEDLLLMLIIGMNSLSNLYKVSAWQRGRLDRDDRTNYWNEHRVISYLVISYSDQVFLFNVYKISEYIGHIICKNIIECDWALLAPIDHFGGSKQN